MKEEVIELRLVLTKQEWRCVEALLASGVVGFHDVLPDENLKEMRKLRDLICHKLWKRGL